LRSSDIVGGVENDLMFSRRDWNAWAGLSELRAWSRASCTLGDAIVRVAHRAFDVNVETVEVCRIVRKFEDTVISGKRMASGKVMRG